MNKTAIKNFAVWARRKLIKDITTKCSQLGITEKGIAKALPHSTNDIKFFDIGTKEYAKLTESEIVQRESLASHIRNKEQGSDFETAFKSIVEEVAYTWFNRLIAIRFMEVNDYLPSRIRVLSSENAAKSEPDFVTTPFDTDLVFTPYERDRVMQLKDENKLDILFRMLFIKQCNKLNENLPELYENTDDYTELLLTISFTDTDGVVYHLVHDIDEDDFNIEKEGQIEIIGWIYQAYITEINEIVYDGTLSKDKISKEMLPAATQLFTPDWPIRYMVENSLGRLWIEGHPNNTLKSNWKYYLDDADQKPEVQAQLEKIRHEYKSINPKDIKFIDPCMGSGHILIYAFDVLMQIYKTCGYTQNDAAISIALNNIYGLDIDDRAFQLAYFSIMMKGRQYDRQFLYKKLKLNLCAIDDTKKLHRDCLKLFGKLEDIAARLADEFIDAKEYGSIINLNITSDELKLLSNKAIEICNTDYNNFFDYARTAGVRTDFLPLIKQAEIMTCTYDVVVTNPPYLGSSRFSPKLSEYINKNYPTVKSDLSMVMFKHALNKLTARDRFISFITTSSWMFLKSFEDIRRETLISYQFESICDFGTELFDGKVGHNPIVAWVNRTTLPIINKQLTAIRLIDYCYSRRNEKHKEFFNIKNKYHISQGNFTNIPGSPIAYWVGKKLLYPFEVGTQLDKICSPRQGLATSDNNRFLREWYEVNLLKIGFTLTSREKAVASKLKWFPYNKGGEFRKWYGNNDYVVNWENDGYEIRNSYGDNGKLASRPQNMNYYFHESITWSKISSGNIAFRYKPIGHLFDVAGTSIFCDNENLRYIHGFCNSKVALAIVNILSPTLNYEVGHIASFPIIIDKDKYDKVINVVDNNVKLSRYDWDSFETSWDFKRHPLINGELTITEAFDKWEQNTTDRFNTLKTNEEELNRIFINIYGLHDELTSEVEDNNVTVRKADLNRNIPSLISYAVGCMFGRYSLDEDGTVYAGGEWDNSKYKSYIPDADNCIPITDENYFNDDIVGRFTEFVKTVYGAETLEENLDFIANTLGNTGNTSREIIRSYFIKDFYKDHCRIYQKRPIYWLFDSGKENGFKALIYMHRYNADTVGNMRIEYLHRMQRIYDNEMIRMQEIIDNGNNIRDIAAAQKRKDKLTKQLKETRDYDVKIAHLALARIEIDLDDGVKVNYEKIQTDTDGKVLDVLAGI